MILSQPNLRKAVEDGLIGFDPPLEEKQWGEASIDLRLGFSFTKFRETPGLTLSVADGLAAIGNLGLWITKELKPKDEFGDAERFILRPGELVLALTHERVRVPRSMIALVEGRSTYARVGLSMHQTAPWIQPGWSGPIVLEMMNHGSIDIALTPLVDRPCQLTFFELKTEVPPEIAYGTRPTDRYQNQQHPLRHLRETH
jgi:dCTP deaminase